MKAMILTIGLMIFGFSFVVSAQQTGSPPKAEGGNPDGAVAATCNADPKCNCPCPIAQKDRNSPPKPAEAAILARVCKDANTCPDGGSAPTPSAPNGAVDERSGK